MCTYVPPLHLTQWHTVLVNYFLTGKSIIFIVGYEPGTPKMLFSPERKLRHYSKSPDPSHSCFLTPPTLDSILKGSCIGPLPNLDTKYFIPWGEETKKILCQCVSFNSLPRAPSSQYRQKEDPRGDFTTQSLEGAKSQSLCVPAHACTSSCLAGFYPQLAPTCLPRAGT